MPVNWRMKIIVDGWSAERLYTNVSYMKWNHLRSETTMTFFILYRCDRLMGCVHSWDAKPVGARKRITIRVNWFNPVFGRRAADRPDGQQIGRITLLKDGRVPSHERHLNWKEDSVLIGSERFSLLCNWVWAGATVSEMHLFQSSNRFSIGIWNEPCITSWLHA